MTPKEIKASREALGITQVALAQELGVTLVTVARWETGKHRIPEATAKLIARMVAEKKGVRPRKR